VGFGGNPVGSSGIQWDLVGIQWDLVGFGGNPVGSSGSGGIQWDPARTRWGTVKFRNWGATDGMTTPGDRDGDGDELQLHGQRRGTTVGEGKTSPHPLSRCEQDGVFLNYVVLYRIIKYTNPTFSLLEWWGCLLFSKMIKYKSLCTKIYCLWLKYCIQCVVELVKIQMQDVQQCRMSKYEAKCSQNYGVYTQCHTCGVL
jgi:hypothetical protein